MNASNNRLLQSLLSGSVDGQEFAMENVADQVLSQASSHPPQDPAVQNFLSRHLQQPDFPTEVLGLQNLVYPDTPSELSVGLQESCFVDPSGSSEAGGGSASHFFSPGEDTFFRFPPDISIQYSDPSVYFVPHRFEDLTFMETPPATPATPTDPSSLFNSYSSNPEQQMPLYSALQGSYSSNPEQQMPSHSALQGSYSSNPEQQMPSHSALQGSYSSNPEQQMPSHSALQGSYSSNPEQQTPPRPRRERLQGTSHIDDEIQDIFDNDPPDDINVFPDLEMPAIEKSEESSMLTVRADFVLQAEAGSLEPCGSEESQEPRQHEALQRSQGSQNLSPLMKDLRQKIIKRRLDNGQDELNVDFSTQSPFQQLSEEDITRRGVRRAQNRDAAQRFRERKKAKEVEIKKKLEENQRLNERLRREVMVLRSEKARLQSLLEQCRRLCRYPLNNDDDDNGNDLLPSSISASTDPRTAALAAVRNNDVNGNENNDAHGGFLHNA